MEQFTLEQIKEKILVEGLKEIQRYYTIFRHQSPINESTNETLSFEEWYKTVEVTKDARYLPRFIIDNLGNIAIKDLYKPYLKTIYYDYFEQLKKKEEGEQDD